MESEWLQLWRDLVARTEKPLPGDLVKRYKSNKKAKTERHDDLLDFVIKRLDNEDTVLDIGAGTGRWTIPSSYYQQCYSYRTINGYGTDAQ